MQSSLYSVVTSQSHYEGLCYHVHLFGDHDSLCKPLNIGTAPEYINQDHFDSFVVFHEI